MILANKRTHIVETKNILIVSGKMAEWAPTLNWEVYKSYMALPQGSKIQVRNSSALAFVASKSHFRLFPYLPIFFTTSFLTFRLNMSGLVGVGLICGTYRAQKKNVLVARRS